MPHVAASTAGRDVDAGRYQRHRPEQTLFYQLVDEYYPAFAALMAEHGKELPGYVQREFEEFLNCGRLEHGFLRVRCETCLAEHLVAFSCKRRGFCPSCGARRMAERRAAMTWAQRLKRVFNIDIETCRECGGAMKVIACIEDPVVIQKILNHLKEKGEYQDAFRLPESRGPPQTSLFG